MKVVHTPIMLDEVLNYLLPIRRVDDVALIVDATVGEGGHSEAFLKRYSRAQVICIDADEEILAKARVRLARFGDRVDFINGWYDEVLEGMVARYRTSVDILFFDLGVSMFHFLESNRGFSFARDESMDMRLNKGSKLTAATVINEYSREELARIIREYGEERFAYRIADRIVRERKKGRIETSRQLEEIVWRAVPKNYRYGRINPSTKTFQAIRIEVNDELGRLGRALAFSGELLRDGGVVGVISFHSLEDRIVKKYFKKLSEGFLKGNEEPIPLNGESNLTRNYFFKPVVKKPVVPGDREVRENPASRSAKLRIYRKVVV